MPCSSTSSRAAVTIRSSDRPRPGRRRRPCSTRACATGPHLETTVVMVAVSSDRQPQPTTSLLMIILKVSCRTSPFSGPQRQSAAGTRGRKRLWYGPRCDHAAWRWATVATMQGLRSGTRDLPSGPAVRDVAGGDQPRADQGCSEMFDRPGTQLSVPPATTLVGCGPVAQPGSPPKASSSSGPASGSGPGRSTPPGGVSPRDLAAAGGGPARRLADCRAAARRGRRRAVLPARTSRRPGRCRRPARCRATG